MIWIGKPTLVKLCADILQDGVLEIRTICNTKKANVSMLAGGRCEIALQSVEISSFSTEAMP